MNNIIKTDYISPDTTDEEIKHKYNELLYAVCRKFPNETRHQTALRYIREAEDVKIGGPCEDKKI